MADVIRVEQDQAIDNVGVDHLVEEKPTGRLRWATPKAWSALPQRRLQQEWMCVEYKGAEVTMKYEWRDVPLEFV